MKNSESKNSGATRHYRASLSDEERNTIMGGSILVPLLILGWIVLVSVLLGFVSALIFAVFAVFNWLYRKCCPRKYVPFNPDVIPVIPESHNLLGA